MSFGDERSAGALQPNLQLQQPQQPAFHIVMVNNNSSKAARSKNNNSVSKKNRNKYRCSNQIL